MRNTPPIDCNELEMDTDSFKACSIISVIVSGLLTIAALLTMITIYIHEKNVTHIGAIIFLCISTVFLLLTLIWSLCMFDVCGMRTFFGQCDPKEFFGRCGDCNCCNRISRKVKYKDIHDDEFL